MSLLDTVTMPIVNAWSSLFPHLSGTPTGPLAIFTQAFDYLIGWHWVFLALTIVFISLATQTAILRKIPWYLLIPGGIIIIILGMIPIGAAMTYIGIWNLIERYTGVTLIKGSITLYWILAGASAILTWWTWG